MPELPTDSSVWPTGDTLRDKYRIERDKRLRRSQRGSVALEGELARYLHDPYVRATARAAIVDHDVEVVIIGAGLGGLMIAAGLRKVGIQRLRLVDSAGDVGGVWYWNRYPGVRCDTEASIYLPMLEEVGVMPPERYATGPQIWAHAQAIAHHFDLYDGALLQTTVTDMTWNETKHRWELATDRGDELESEFVVMANGSLQKLRLPDIPGIENFRGKAFHTSRWDYDYTGGSAVDDPDELGDQTIAVIGTGATGVQCVPPLGRSAKEVFVFQRTPSTVGVRNNGPVDPDWVSSLPTGWQTQRRRNFTAVIYGGDVDEDLVGDGWTQAFRALIADPRYRQMSPADAAAAREQADVELMEGIRARVAETIEDPVTAEAMKPWYPYLCKRPTFHDEYLPSFNRGNVHLVDTQGAGVERITEDGLVANGREYKVDAIVFATGFEGATSYTDRIGFDPFGRDGVRLSEKWRNGLRTFHGIMTAGFPNCLFQAMPFGQNTVTVNFPDMMQENASQMVYIIDAVRRRGGLFEVTSDAEDAWVQMIIDLAPDDRAFLEQCTPGRGNNEGVARPLQNRDFGRGPLEFFALLRRWRESDQLPGLQIEALRHEQLTIG